MSEFDGEIRINTKINTADAEKMLMKCRLPRLLTQQGLTTIERVDDAG